MTADPLLARLSAVPMRCADCGNESNSCGHDAREPDYAAIARAVRMSGWVNGLAEWTEENTAYLAAPRSRARRRSGRARGDHARRHPVRAARMRARADLAGEYGSRIPRAVGDRVRARAGAAPVTRLRLAPDLAGLDEDIAGELPKLSCGSPPRSPPSCRLIHTDADTGGHVFEYEQVLDRAWQGVELSVRLA